MGIRGTHYDSSPAPRRVRPAPHRDLFNSCAVGFFWGIAPTMPSRRLRGGRWSRWVDGQVRGWLKRAALPVTLCGAGGAARD